MEKFILFVLHDKKEKNVAIGFVICTVCVCPPIDPIKMRIQFSLSYDSCWLILLDPIFSLGSITEAFGRGLGLRSVVQ